MNLCSEEIMKIIINKSFGIYNVGQTICMPDEKGIPTDIFWRRRLKDSEIDKCCSVVIEEKSKNKKASKNKITDDKGVK